MRLSGVVLVIGLSLHIASCGDGTLSISDYESHDVTVWVSAPSGHQYDLGVVRGARACGARAWAFASEKGFSTAQNWGYVCCTHRQGSTCYEKIR